jgi:hypothetical protein
VRKTTHASLATKVSERSRTKVAYKNKVWQWVEFGNEPHFNLIFFNKTMLRLRSATTSVEMQHATSLQPHYLILILVQPFFVWK